MKALDTNVLVRLLVRDDPEQAAVATAEVARLTPASPGYVTVVTLAEIAWVLERGYRIPRAETLTALRRVVTADGVRVERPRDVERALDSADQGADFGDALIDAVSRSDGCATVVTFDRKAAKRLGWELLGSP
ncbi:MAG: type II toxin-antitoxin system VapC family toxin [Dermatophilus congolensis]|nr:type II toxin-antitoxin system VapC family toxin [Dermatophilus congolensis]